MSRWVVVVVVITASSSIGCNVFDPRFDDFDCQTQADCTAPRTCVMGTCVLSVTDADSNAPDADPNTPDADPNAPDADDVTVADAGLPGPDAKPLCSDPIALMDDFADGTPSPLWTAAADAQASADEVGGELVITLSSSASGRFASYSSVLTFNLTGSRLHVEVPQAVTNTALMTFRFGVNGNNSVLFEKRNNNLVFEGRDLMVAIGGNTVAYNPSDHRWWQIRETGGTLFAEVSANGQSWTVFQSIPTPSFVGDGGVLLQAGTPVVENNPGEAHFDNVNGGSEPLCP